MNNQSSNNSNESRLGMDHFQKDAAYYFRDSKIIQFCFFKYHNYKTKDHEKSARVRTRDRSFSNHALRTKHFLGERYVTNKIYKY